MTSRVVLMHDGREPYATMARALIAQTSPIRAEVVAPLLADEHPAQAKRWAVEAGFDSGADCVWYVDADCEVSDPAVWRALVSTPRCPGIHTRSVHRGDLAVKALGLRHWRVCQEILAEYRLRVCDVRLPRDYVLAYVLPNEDQRALFFVAWDHVAEVLRRADLNWTDGVSIGIAAAVAGVQIVADLDSGEVTRAIYHHGLSMARDPYWFRSWKVQR